MPAWQEMFGSELQVGFHVAVPARNGAKGTEPLTAGWYPVKTLRRDGEGDWVIGIGDGRYQWLLSWDTLPAAETEPTVPCHAFDRVPALKVRPGRWVYIPLPVKRWLQVASYPRRSTGDPTKVVVTLLDHEPVIFDVNNKISISVLAPAAL